MEPLSPLEIALRIGAALVLGGVMGLERERKHRPAGLRTMILISIGSAGFVIAGHEAIAAIVVASKSAEGATTYATMGAAEISRILQGLIGGIGFLGAGAVIQNKMSVRGLTTAAAVWVVAVVGAACGLGVYLLAALLSVGALFTLVILEIVENRYFPEQPNADWEAKKGAIGLAREEKEVITVRDWNGQRKNGTR
jgi:putative Mg2+ transporter-C (MgtC) family protein